MMEGGFEWDDAKAAANYLKHGVSFDTAKRAFQDSFHLERLDDREDYGGERLLALGMVDGWFPSWHLRNGMETYD